MVYIKPNPLWGGSPTVKTLEELKNDLQGSVDNVTSGGRITNPYSSEALAFAENEYCQIRMMMNDVAQIAEHTGENESVIKEIKNYLFIDNSLYDEDSKTYRQFDPDCAIA